MPVKTFDPAGQFGPGQPASSARVERVGHAHSTAFGTVYGLDDICPGHVASLHLARDSWVKGKKAARFGVNDGGADGGRIDGRDGPPVHPAVGGHKGNRAAIAEHSVVADRCVPVDAIAGSYLCCALHWTPGMDLLGPVQADLPTFALVADR